MIVRSVASSGNPLLAPTLGTRFSANVDHGVAVLVDTLLLADTVAWYQSASETQPTAECTPGQAWKAYVRVGICVRRSGENMGFEMPAWVRAGQTRVYK